MIKMRDLLKESDTDIIRRLKNKIPNFNNKPKISKTSTIDISSIPFFANDVLETKYTKLIKLMLNINKENIIGARGQYFPGDMEFTKKINDAIPIIYLNHLVNEILNDHKIYINGKQFIVFRMKLVTIITDYLNSIGIARSEYKFDFSGL